MDAQTLVNRIEEMHSLALGMVEVSKSEVGKKLNTNNYKGQAQAYESLLLWLSANGLKPDTAEME